MLVSYATTTTIEKKISTRYINQKCCVTWLSPYTVTIMAEFNCKFWHIVEMRHMNEIKKRTRKSIRKVQRYKFLKFMFEMKHSVFICFHMFSYKILVFCKFCWT